ncbi:glycoside hydrolase family 71 protein [Aspergillus lucknowensis]|uniref:Glycoside hydrolase n=1 Tax=Aspergillus lucknowensis TaxID=176173 RepID=A0ABR4M008_9EURO
MPLISTWTLSLSIILLSISFLPQCAHSKAVFAHFMVSNTKSYTPKTWKSSILTAQSASIDAFALNAGYDTLKHAHTPQALADAFAAAQELDFKLFFSLDYSGDGHWPRDRAVDLLKEYTDHPAYFRHSDGRALVSTFEGFESAGDWGYIKGECCIFIPDWTSAGPRRASTIADVDGLMSWIAWPEGTSEMTTTTDEAYLSALRGRPYIMPVSPWFYTNLRRFGKNWVWRGDDLWYTRWQQVLGLDPQPEYVEILTWNDYGESHYIGPLPEERGEVAGILDEAGAPFDYVTGMPHDGWRVLLPYLIAQYKATTEEERQGVEIGEEVLSVWYRVSHADACKDGGTTGKSKAPEQNQLAPGEVLEDRVFYSALLEEEAEVRVSIGGDSQSAEWMNVPDGGKGVYHGSVPMGERTGEVVVTLSRKGEALAEMKGASIERECARNLTNWNAWVGNATARTRPKQEGGKESRAAARQPWGSLLAFTCFCLILSL